MNGQEPAGNYLDIQTAAQRLGVCKETLRRWDKKGSITSYRTPGGYRRFLEVDIDNILQEVKKVNE